MICMDAALNELVSDEPFREELRAFFRMVAEHMHNQ
jgi:truncated hemoglobin YjbI